MISSFRPSILDGGVRRRSSHTNGIRLGENAWAVHAYTSCSARWNCMWPYDKFRRICTFASTVQIHTCYVDTFLIPLISHRICKSVYWYTMLRRVGFAYRSQGSSEETVIIYSNEIFTSFGIHDRNKCLARIQTGILGWKRIWQIVVTACSVAIATACSRL